PEFGFKPIVYKPSNPTYPIVDEALRNEVPDVEIISRPITEPYGIASVLSKNKIDKISAGIIPDKKRQSWPERFSLWIRGNLFIPDARVLWVNPSVRYLKDYIKENNIDAVITTGPPHSIHITGMKLREMLPINWIADFRDPWTTIGYHKELKLSDYAAKKHKLLEKKVLNTADQIIVTSKTTKAEFAKITNKPIEVITNGFDVETIERQLPDKKFSLAHIGSLLSERNPEILWRALSEMVETIPEFAADLEIKLIGTVSSDVLKSVQQFSLSDFVNNLGYVSHADAIAHQRRSQLLLLIEIDSPNTRGIIPGKLFEYMASGRPIVGIGPAGAEFAEIIAETNTGDFVDYSEFSRLKEILSSHYLNFKNGSLKSAGVGIENYSRRNLTRKLANLIAQMELLSVGG
ncbi:MAG: glycosyltransferase, partial [Flavobacterium sp.]|nr:glycosyltransferase [Flavobacterium sp.]